MRKQKHTNKQTKYTNKQTQTSKHNQTQTCTIAKTTTTTKRTPTTTCIGARNPYILEIALNNTYSAASVSPNMILANNWMMFPRIDSNSLSRPLIATKRE